MDISSLHSRRFVSLFLLIGVIMILGLSFFLTGHEMRISETDISGLQLWQPDSGILVHFDEAYYQKNTMDGQRVNIRGWAVVRGKETRPVEIHVLLRNEITGKCYRLPTEIRTRSDVTELLSEDYANYDSSGFVSDVIAPCFDFQMDAYRVLILYEMEDGPYLIDSGEVLAEKEAES